MNPLTDKQLLALLVRVVHCTIQDFYYFPEVIKAGKQRMEKDDFNFLIAEGYIVKCGADSFGGFYKHTQKAELFIYHSITSPHHSYRKKRKAIAKQGELTFA